MRGGFKEQLLSAATALSQAAVSGAKAASKFVQQEALGAQCLLDYNVTQLQIASAGPGLAVWRVFTARSKKEGSPHPVVSAWILDKRELVQAEEQLYGGHSSGGLTRPSQRRLETFVEQCRHDVQALARLKHPCVLRLIAPLEETRTQLVFITEPVFASLADLLGSCGGPAALPPSAAQERRALRLSELEIKHGLLQLADGLHFLHAEAGLIHKGLSPASCIITTTGAWKLAGFAFSSPLDFQAPQQHRAYDYSNPDPSLLQLATQPPLPYVAPELVAAGSSSSITGAADVFSLGAITFELLTQRQLLPVGSRLADYESRVHSLTLVDMSGVPMALEATLRGMVAPVATARPPAAAFAGCQYFQADVLLRALKFLDTMLQREPLQKAAFLRDLPAMCAQFDSRVLRYLVLPPLLQELRDVTLQPTLLPIVLSIVQQQQPAEFEDATLPFLKPLLVSASGETLLLLVQNAELLGKCMPQAAAAQVLPALLVRAAEHGDVRAQEEMLKRVAGMADSLDYEALKKVVLPAVHKLCLGTTSASVRVSAFAAMSRLVARMDAAEAETMLQTAVKVTAVDRSAPTVMCVLALGASLGKQHGARLCAERVLPALVPLLVAPTLNAQQFGTAMRTVREALALVEQSRGGAGATDGVPGGIPGAAAGNGALGGAAMGGKAAGGATAAAAGAPTDWLAATSVGPAGGSSPAGRLTAQAGGGGFGATANSGNSASDPLAGLQLQQPAAAPRPAASAAGSGVGFRPAGAKIGSGLPMGAPLAAPASRAPAQPAQQSNWAFGGSAAGSSNAFGSSSGAAPASSALADPFAALQLGGTASSSNTWPAKPAPTQSSSTPAFDPFALGNSATPSDSTQQPGFGGSSLQWPVPAQQQRQPVQQQQQRAGAGGWQGESLI